MTLNWRSSTRAYLTALGCQIGTQAGTPISGQISPTLRRCSI
jgi:hypothetical protein